jgi:hypothetical protein
MLSDYHMENMTCNDDRCSQLNVTYETLQLSLRLDQNIVLFDAPFFFLLLLVVFQSHNWTTYNIWTAPYLITSRTGESPRKLLEMKKEIRFNASYSKEEHD